MRRCDEAVGVVDRGNLFLAKEIEELLVLVEVGLAVWPGRTAAEMSRAPAVNAAGS